MEDRDFDPLNLMNTANLDPIKHSHYPILSIIPFHHQHVLTCMIRTTDDPYNISTSIL